MPIERLFNAINETNHVYAWDYTTQEEAVALYDAGKNHFALITRRREIADETGAMGDYRDNMWTFGYLFSKQEPKPTEQVPENTRGTSTIDSFVNEDSVISEIKKRTGVSDIRKVESIELSVGRVYISGGNLVLDRK